MCKENTSLKIFPEIFTRKVETCQMPKARIRGQKKMMLRKNKTFALEENMNLS